LLRPYCVPSERVEVPLRSRQPLAIFITISVSDSRTGKLVGWLLGIIPTAKREELK
jgi:hypothetical protein